MKLLYPIVALTYLFLSSSSNAQIEKCKNVSDSTKRLKCYDENANSKSITKPVQTGSWIEVSKKDPITDDVSTYIYLPTSEKKSLMRNTHVLVVRCKNNKTELFVTWDRYLFDDPEVTTRVDKQRAESKDWGLSNTGKATFLLRPIRFIKSILDAKKLVVRATSRRGTPETAIFQVSGLASAITPIRKQCSW